MNEPRPTVETKTQALIDKGATQTWEFFRINDENQADLVYEDRRFLITPNDEKYKEYAHSLGQAGLLFLDNDPALGDDSVVVAEISRDSRSLPQLLRGHQPDSGYDLSSVFRQIGGNVRRLEAQQGLAPTPESLNIRKILVVRGLARVMFTPPFELEEFTPDSNDRIIEAVQKQLEPEYKKFGAPDLLASLKVGLEDGSS